MVGTVVKCERRGEPGLDPRILTRRSRAPICALRRHSVFEDVGGIALAQSLERAITELSHPLAGHVQLTGDLLKRHGPVPLEAEVQGQHPSIARRQYLEGPRNRLTARIALHAAWKDVLVLAAIQH